MWMSDVVATTQTSSHLSISFRYWRLCELRPWRHDYFVNSWGIAFGLGCDNLRCVISELHLVCFPVFGSVDPFRDVSVRTADIETLGAIYIDCCVPVMLGGPIGSETR
ncbi:hypothetical protein YC2023_015532 [Brassica napus]